MMSQIVSSGATSQGEAIFAIAGGFVRLRTDSPIKMEYFRYNKEQKGEGEGPAINPLCAYTFYLPHSYYS